MSEDTTVKKVITRKSGKLGNRDMTKKEFNIEC